MAIACNTSKKETLTIATAANMQFAMEALTKEFTKQYGINCQLVISSSGKLTAQIQSGAPYDVFVSADLKYPTELYQKGLTVKAPEVYATGTLVLWTTTNNITPTLLNLKNNRIKHIALANPKTAPYGKAAMEVLTPYIKNLKHKFVYGESIAQVNQFVNTQVAQVGFTSLSVVLAQQKGSWNSIPKDLYTPIKQGIVIIKQTNYLDKATLFYNFVFSKTGKEILKKHGCL